MFVVAAGFVIGVMVQVYSIFACMRIARNRSIIASHRWIASMFVFFFPVLGILFFKLIESGLHYRQFCFFSGEFIDDVLYQNVPRDPPQDDVDPGPYYI